MPYNLDLEERIDRLTDRLGNVAKKRMFGGIGYLLRGNMCFGIHKESLVIRTSPDKAEELRKNDYFSPFDITGRPMKGWLLVSPDALTPLPWIQDQVRDGEKECPDAASDPAWNG